MWGHASHWTVHHIGLCIKLIKLVINADGDPHMMLKCKKATTCQIGPHIKLAMYHIWLYLTLVFRGNGNPHITLSTRAHMVVGAHTSHWAHIALVSNGVFVKKVVGDPHGG